MPGRVDPLLDDAGGFLASIGDILGACAARAAVSHEAVVVEAVAPRHVGGVLASERGEGTVGAQLTGRACAEAVERVAVSGVPERSVPQPATAARAARLQYG